jgi:electron transfer flavoprotein beta subunit
MKIIVCIKQVPDTSDIKWTENNTMQREGVESIINPFDLYAIEEALKIKKSIENVEITVLTMGPLQASEILKYAISLGCDKAVLLSDKKFAGADTYATGKTIASFIKNKLPDFDLILCGQFAIDGDTAQTGPSIASQLDIPQVTFVRNLERYEETSMYAQRLLEDGTETVSIELPVLACIVKGDYETTRPSINGIKRANNTPVEIYSLEDIGLSPEEAGIKGSPTYVSKAFRPVHDRGECTFCQTYASLADKIKEYANE